MMYHPQLHADTGATVPLNYENLSAYVGATSTIFNDLGMSPPGNGAYVGATSTIFKDLGMSPPGNGRF